MILAYGLPKETVFALMTFYNNTKIKVHSPNGDTDFFDIVARVLQRDILAPYLFKICLDYILRMLIDLIKENDFTLKKRPGADDILQEILQTQTMQIT